jgi:L-arabinose isomerase
LLAAAYFEYYRMYDNVESECAADMQVIADRLAAQHDLVYPGMVSTLDEADRAGRTFRENQIELLIVTEATYTPDYILHQALHAVPADLPILVFVSQAHDKLDFDRGYDQSLRNSGPMGLAQLTASFRKMGKYQKYDVVVGSVRDDEAYAEIDRFIRVHTTIAELRQWTIGVIGHVFRGMYDFQYDKTALQGKLGPHVMELQSAHLAGIMEEYPLGHPKVVSLKDHVYANYDVRGLTEEEVLRAARLAVSLQQCVERYRLNGLALLGQHYIERIANSTCHLGVSEILRSDKALAVTEGDVIGLIMCKVLKDFTGHTPFFGEWEEYDRGLNAVMLLGHGFVDPRIAREDRPVVVPACEQWGFEGNGFGFQASFRPGPVTMTHVIQDADGWRILVTGGEIADTPPFSRLGESAMVVKVEKPVKQFFRELMKFGFAHHSIAAYGEARDYLEVFAEQVELEVCRI